VKELDGGHLAAALGNLDTVADEDKSPVHAQGSREMPQYDLRPKPGHPIEIDGRAVEGLQKVEVALLLEAERPDGAGDPEPIGSHGHSRDAGCKPKKAS